MLDVKKSDILRASTVKRASEILKFTSADYIKEKKISSDKVD